MPMRSVPKSSEITLVPSMHHGAWTCHALCSLLDLQHQQLRMLRMLRMLRIHNMHHRVHGELWGCLICGRHVRQICATLGSQ